MKSAGRERRSRSLALVAACIIAASGCRDAAPPPSDDPGVTAPSTTIVESTTAPPTTATTLVPLDQDPPVIDLAYAQRVLDEISRLDHEASLILYREKRTTPEYEAIITSIFFGEALADAREAAAKDLTLGLTTWRDPPGLTTRKAERILSSRPGCMALIADSDFRSRYKNPISVSQDIGVVVKRNIEPTADDRRINPSLWLLTLSGTIAPGTNLGEVCE